MTSLTKKTGNKPPIAAQQAKGVKKSAKPRKIRTNGAEVSDQQRYNLVQIAAYYIAERRGFPGGSELQDWVEAESQIERMLKQSRNAL